MKCEFKKLIEKTKKNSPHHHSNFKTDTLYNLSHSLGPENINIYIYIYPNSYIKSYTTTLHCNKWPKPEKDTDQKNISHI